MLVRNYRGEMVEAPKDLPNIVVSISDDFLVWSTAKKNGKHQVRYGLQVKSFHSPILAFDEFRYCLFHHLSCGGIV